MIWVASIVRVSSKNERKEKAIQEVFQVGVTLADLTLCLDRRKLGAKPFKLRIFVGKLRIFVNDYALPFFALSLFPSLLCIVNGGGFVVAGAGKLALFFLECGSYGDSFVKAAVSKETPESP